MQPEQKQWVRKHGTPAEQQFVAKYGDRGVSAGGLLTSVLFYVGFAALFFLIVGGYLYLSRASFLRPVTGTWVGVLAEEGGSGKSTAVLLQSSVNPFLIHRPTLAGSVRLCSGAAEQQFALEQTQSVSADTLGVTMASQSSPEGGRLFGALRGGEFQVIYNGSATTLQGKLQRGSQSDYQQSCASQKR